MALAGASAAAAPLYQHRSAASNLSERRIYVLLLLAVGRPSRHSLHSSI
jgi:hypothetical protein